MKFVMVDLVDGMRPRSNQAHLPAQHVPELRQFVEAVAADNTADAGDSGVVVDLEGRAFSLVAIAQVFLEVCGVGHHGAKLVATEAAAFGAGALRGVDDRTAQAREAAEAAFRNHLDIRAVPDLPPGPWPDSGIDRIGEVPVITLHREPLPSAALFLKRLLDVTGAMVGLVLVSPLMAIVALLIRRDSPGPDVC